MKKYLTVTILSVALVAGLAAAATSATAFPTKRTSCSACHGSTRAITITLTRKSSTAKTVTYAVKVTGGKGKAGWAVLAGRTNLARRTSYTGTFTIAKGRTVRVWGIKTGTGARYRTLTAK